METSKLIFRPYEEGDEHAILETFNRTFREVCGPDFEDRNLETWRWEFLENPSGCRIMLALTSEGRVAAQYAGVPIKVSAEGRELSFFHAVDSMVHPEFRKGLRKRPLFLEVAERFFERFAGKVDHLGFGYPVRPAWRIGERYLGYRLVQVLDFLLRGIEEPLPPHEAAAEVCEGVPPDCRALLEELAPLHACTTVRDEGYLRWRYFEAPSVRYRFLAARRAGKLVGFGVCRTEGGLVPEHAVLGDVFCDPGDLDCLAALLERARVEALDAGRRGLMTVVNPHLEYDRSLKALGFRAHPSGDWLERKLGARDWTAGLEPEWLRRNWHYCLGDSDLF